MDVTRRGALVAAGVAVGTAGCLSDLDLPANTENEGPDGVDHEVFHLPPTMARPLWAVDEEATGVLSLLASEDDHLWMVDDPSDVDGLEAWYDETDWATAVVVYVQSVGPTACYERLAVSEVGVEDDTIVGTAEAVDTSEKDAGCGAAITYPRALVRVTGDAVPAAARFTVTDGGGSSSQVAADGQLVDPAALPGHVRPSGDPPELETFACDDEDIHRLERPDGAVSWGETRDADGTVTFALRVHGRQADGGSHGDSPVFGRGDEVRLTMHNVSTEPRVTGNRHKYTLQVLTEDGWQDVRGTTDGEPVAYTDEAVIHPPGEGFGWSFELTEAGVVAGHPQADRLAVCPDLQPGRYRFVIWEVSGEQLGASFHYTG